MKPKANDGIEFIHAPPPTLKKAMAWQYAEPLITAGKVRLPSILEYRKLNPAKPWQTDPYEDIEIEVRNGVWCQASSATPPFVWCCATHDADSDLLLNVDPEYDTIVTIADPIAFFQQIRTAVQLVAPWARFQAGLVSYNKGGPATPYFWGKCTFQKHQKYSYQSEYRLAFYEPTGISNGKSITPVYQGKPYADLVIGSCTSALTTERIWRTTT